MHILQRNIFVFLLIGILIFPLRSLAQSNASDAALEGYIRDTSDSPVGGADVSARNIETNTIAKAKTDEQGYYRFPILKIGTYDVTVTAAGFKTATQTDLSLRVGQTGRTDMQMQLGTASESVEVKAEGPITDTGAASTGAVLSRKEVEDLPVISRNIYNFHLLSPGVQGITSSTFGTTQFTFGGTERSYWTVDGLDNT
jgi:Carboxypeptidase regulatory-like domain